MGGPKPLKLLLDTHIWLWSLLEPERLVPEVAGQLEAQDAELWLSPISVWETLMLAEKGRLQLDGDPGDWVEKQLRAVPMRDAALTRAVALHCRKVDVSHGDPADRFIAATAVVYDLVLVTADARLLEAQSVQVLPNR